MWPINFPPMADNCERRPQKVNIMVQPHSGRLPHESQFPRADADMRNENKAVPKLVGQEKEHRGVDPPIFSSIRAMISTPGCDMSFRDSGRGPLPFLMPDPRFFSKRKESSMAEKVVTAFISTCRGIICNRDHFKYPGSTPVLVVVWAKLLQTACTTMRRSDVVSCVFVKLGNSYRKSSLPKNTGL